MKTSRILTGIKPTGSVHLGNYFSAILPILKAQEEGHDIFLFIADLHALNIISDPEVLRKNIHHVLTVYLAAGVDPEKVTIFQQSHLPHATLATILGARLGLGALERAHAFKDAKAKGDVVNFGTFSYPVLMAADILMYKPDIIPVGKDQQQHVEMARDLAESFHRAYGETFVLPRAQVIEGLNVPGLDGRKMSKSYQNTLGLMESPAELTKKVMKIVTDSKGPSEPKDPSTCTIFQLYTLLASADAVANMRQQYEQGGISYKEAKEALVSVLLPFVDEFQQKANDLISRPDYLQTVLESGAAKARRVAESTLDEVFKKTGLQ